MTRKDYVKFAEGFRSGKPQLCEGVEMARGFQLAIDIAADIFAHDNPKFDRQTFYAACRPEMPEVDPTCAMCENGDEPGHEH